MYFKIQRFLTLKFCSTHHGWGGTASSSQTVCVHLVPWASRERTRSGDSKASCVNPVLPGSGGLQMQPGRKKLLGGLLDPGTEAQRASSPDRGLWFTAHFYSDALRTLAKAGSKVLLNVLTAA